MSRSGRSTSATCRRKERFAEVEILGAKLMDAVGKVVPALPVSLVATAILDAHPAALSLFDIKGRVSKIIETLEHSGAYVHIPRSDRDYAIEVGLRMLKLRRIVNETRRHLFRQSGRIFTFCAITRMRLRICFPAKLP
jgi:hypothetical protein